MNNWKEKLHTLKINQSITYYQPTDSKDPLVIEKDKELQETERRAVFNAASSLKKETQGKFNYMVRKNVIWRIK